MVYIYVLPIEASLCVLGEDGQPVYVGVQEKQAADRSTREFGFNMVASDKIAMDRNIPDTRSSE